MYVFHHHFTKFSLRKLSRVLRRYSTSTSVLPTYEKVTYNKHGPVVVIGINNPDRKNSLDKKGVAELKDAFKVFEEDKTALAGVLYGEYGNFCAGYDLKELSENAENPPEHFLLNNLTERFIQKPLVAAISGYAVGAGLDLALMCDLRLMEETAVLGCFNRRFGVPLSEYAIQRLQSMIGTSRTLEMVLRARFIRSEEAFRIGLVTQIVDVGTAAGQALNLAVHVAKFPQAALLVDRAKIYKYSYPSHPDRTRIEKETTAYRDVMLEDIKHGAKLFAEGHGREGRLLSRFLFDNFEKDEETCNVMIEE